MSQQRNGCSWVLRGFEVGFVAGWLFESLLVGDFGLHVGGLFAAFLGGFVGTLAALFLFAVIVGRTSEYPEPFEARQASGGDKVT